MVLNFNRDELANLNGSEVYDNQGKKLGKIDSIFLDDNTQEPTFFEVKGGFLGTKDFFIPFQYLNRDNHNYSVPFDEKFLKDSPDIKADQHMSNEEMNELYRYYEGNHTMNREHVTHDNDLLDRDNMDKEGVRDMRNDAIVTDRDVNATAERDRVNHRDNDSDSMVLREEQLNVGTETVEAGRVGLHKTVVTEQQTVEVPVEREEVKVVREPIADGHAYDGDLGNEEVSVSLHEERPVVSKETVAVERVGLETGTVRENVQIQEEVRKEQAEIVKEGKVESNREHYDRDHNVLDKDHDGRVELNEDVDRRDNRWK